MKYFIGIERIDWNQLVELYGEVGLVSNYGQKKDYEKIKEVFLRSYKVVTAWNNGKLVAAGRMLSDGICYGSIFDVGVLPEYQKKGIGKQIVLNLLKNNEHICIYLTSTFGNEGFYKKLGFVSHKTAMAKYPFKSEYLDYE